jgi:hypothetical protein
MQTITHIPTIQCILVEIRDTILPKINSQGCLQKSIFICFVHCDVWARPGRFQILF